MTYDPTAVPPAGYIDLLPVEVFMPDGSLVRRGRVVVTPDHVAVWAQNPSEPSDVQLVLDVPVLAVLEWPNPYGPYRRQRVQVQTTQGPSNLVANVVGRCSACGNPGLANVDAAAHYPGRTSRRSS